MKINLYNSFVNQTKQVKVGFSWTVFFFGSFPALFRGDFKWFIIIFFANMLTAGFSNLFFMFFYNKLYINDLLLKGYQPVDRMSEQTLMSRGFHVNPINQEDELDDLDF